MLDSIEAREEDRKKIAQQTAEFLAGGGSIDQVIIDHEKVKQELSEKYRAQYRSLKKR